MKSDHRLSGLLALVAGAWIATGASPASAHHVMDGKLPSTFAQGLLSGMGHPVLGPDHLAFLVALGIAAALARSGVALIGAFIAASMAGVMVHLAKLDVPLIEPMVAGTVIVAGALIALSHREGETGRGEALWLALAAVAGMLHGYAFGESIVGAERTVIGAYLIGIALVAAMIAYFVKLASRRLLTADAIAGRRRAVGGTLGTLGLALLTFSLIAT